MNAILEYTHWTQPSERPITGDRHDPAEHRNRFSKGWDEGADTCDIPALGAIVGFPGSPAEDALVTENLVCAANLGQCVLPGDSWDPGRTHTLAETQHLTTGTSPAPARPSPRLGSQSSTVPALCHAGFRSPCGRGPQAFLPPALLAAGTVASVLALLQLRCPVQSRRSPNAENLVLLMPRVSKGRKSSFCDVCSQKTVTWTTSPSAHQGPDYESGTRMALGRTPVVRGFLPKGPFLGNSLLDSARMDGSHVALFPKFPDSSNVVGLAPLFHNQAVVPRPVLPGAASQVAPTPTSCTSIAPASCLGFHAPGSGLRALP